MSQLIADIDQRTRMVGQNRMELLLFHLGTTQTFGINVFKVREVIARPKLRQLPGSSPMICGVANIRGQTVAVVDLALSIGFAHQSTDIQQDAKVIVTEFNRSVQGFWVSGVNRIVNVNWEAVKPPPHGTGHDSYLVAVTEIDKRWVEIIDVERVFAQINPLKTDIAENLKKQGLEQKDHNGKVLIVDDSMVARKQIERSVTALGFQVETKPDGRAAFDYLKELAANGNLNDISLIISDIEMPRMDGYTLTSRIRNDDQLRGLHIVLHSSLSGQFNADLVKTAGADAFLPKFDPDELATTVLKYLS
jgi:two-component system chemotaxis response regulator CheV